MTSEPFENWGYLLLSAAVAALLASVFSFLQKREAPGWIWLVVAVAFPAGVLVSSPATRVYSFHGFMHTGIVYRILHGGIPPDDPMLAGTPLAYPWAIHGVVAGVVRLADVTPPTGFAIVNLVSLALVLILVSSIASRVAPSARRFAVLLAVFGLGFSNTIFLAAILSDAFGFFFEFRGTPPIEYATTVHATPLGLVFFLLFLRSLLLALDDARLRQLAGIVVGLVGSAFVYPFYFVSAVAVAGAIGLVEWAAGALDRRRGIVLGTVVAVAGIVVAPYLVSLMVSKGPAGEIAIVRHPTWTLEKLREVLIFLGPLAWIAAFEKTTIARALRPRLRIVRPVAVAAGTLLLLHLVVEAPLRVEYKFLTLAVFPLGVLGSVAVESLALRSALAGFLVLALFLLPASADAVLKTLVPWRLTVPFVETGDTLSAADPDEEALYSWIREATPPDAVFVDTELRIPVFGQRRLLVALDPEVWPKSRGQIDGWAFRARTILRDMVGYPSASIDCRVESAEALLAARPVELGGCPFEPAAPVYVVVRDPAAVRRFDESTGFEAERSTAAGTIFRVRR